MISELFGAIKEVVKTLAKPILKLLDPHRRKVGQDVEGTTVFWTTVASAFLYPYVFQNFGGWKAVAVTWFVLEVLDTIAFMIEDRYFDGKIKERIQLIAGRAV